MHKKETGTGPIEVLALIKKLQFQKQSLSRYYFSMAYT